MAARRCAALVWSELMNLDASYRVFVSYTGQDLEAHAEVVSDMVRRLNAVTGRSWLAIDHKYWAPTGRPSVRECMEQVDRCQILVVLVAFRYGWVPTQEEGGDGEASITCLEVTRARKRGLEVIPFLVEDNATWNISHVEGLVDPTAQKRLRDFKAELKKSLAGFFDTPMSLESQVVLALNQAADRIERRVTGPQLPRAIVVSSDPSEVIVPSYFDPLHPPTLEERLETRLPKRILSIDSAGVRTAVALGYLKRLEALLRIRYGDPDFRLRDYFDLIGATGPAAIIAAQLARGRTVDEATTTFLKCIEAMLSARSWFGGVRPAYSSSRLAGVLEASFGDTTLSSPELQTGLSIVLTRVDTGEMCVFTNHPSAQPAEGRRLPLSRVLLASMSMPGYLSPVELPVRGDGGSFCSGEICVGPDPALHLFLVATGPGFPFRWRTGRRRLQIVSIGSGILTRMRREPESLHLQYALRMIVSMIDGMKQQSDLVLAALTHDDESPNGQSILRYQRFDVALEAPTLHRIGLAALAAHIDSVVSMDRTDSLMPLLRIGIQAGQMDLDGRVFDASFDVRPGAEAFTHFAQ
jgi:hypothetical protein